MRNIIYSILLFAFVSISCNDEITNPQLVKTIIVNSTDQYLPSKVGNYWNYIDSLYQENKFTVTNHRTTIIKEEVIDNKTWYTIDNLLIGMMSFGYYYWLDNKIYSRFVTWTPNYYTEGVKIIPAKEFGINYGMTISSDTGGIFVFAIHYKKNYKVNNFIFSEYFEYSYSGGLEEYKVIIVPGIGVVDFYEIGQDYPGRKGFILRSSIENYSIN
jgi:hypothetical protein